MKNIFNKDDNAVNRCALLKGCKYTAELVKPIEPVEGVHWKVKINGKTFKYFEGIGHYVPQGNKLMHQNAKNVLQGGKLGNGYRLGQDCLFLANRVKVKNMFGNSIDALDITPPELESVMYCLLSDYQCATNCDSFEDFCSEFGYEIDSRKALKTYKELQANAVKVAGLGLDLNALADAFTDY